MTISKDEPSCLILLEKHPDLVKQLQLRLGDPTDSYWNGSHTWFNSNESVDFEWRLHPVSGFKMPEASRPEDLFDLALEDEVDASHYWEGLEVFSISDDPIELNELREFIASTLGIEPDFAGHVDHETIGNEYERNNGKVSIVKLLIDQMTSGGPSFLNGQ